MDTPRPSSDPTTGERRLRGERPSVPVVQLRFPSIAVSEELILLSFLHASLQTGTGRMQHLKDVSRRFKSAYRLSVASSTSVLVFLLARLTLLLPRSRASSFSPRRRLQGGNRCYQEGQGRRRLNISFFALNGLFLVEISPSSCGGGCVLRRERRGDWVGRIL